MTVANESKEAFRDLSAHGKLRGIDEVVFFLLTTHHEAMDAREAHTIFKLQGHPLGDDMKYNDVQQAFTRLADEKRIIKTGTHKNSFTKRKTGLFRIRTAADEAPRDMFLSNGAVEQHDMAKK